MEYIAEPLNRKQLRQVAQYLRNLLCLRDSLYFPVLSFLECVMPTLFPGFHYEIIEKNEFPIQKHADTDVVNRIVRIREDVYYGAVSGKGRDRMTIMHEIAHFLLIVVCGVKFNRAFGDVPVVPYKDPEWQAKALAGEIMCPVEQIKDFSVHEVARRCGVSWQAAELNLKIAKGGGVH